VINHEYHDLSLSKQNSSDQYPLLSSWAHQIKQRLAEVAAVPEAETSAMLLTGLGLVGLMVRRRKNTQA
jgi:hypothetical protein